MTCRACGEFMTGSRCVCGYSVAKLSGGEDPMQAWTTCECQAPNCHTVIRERIGATGSQFCRFCLAKGVNLEAPTQTLRLVPNEGPCISQEEFGMDLYECIKKFSEREWIQAQYWRTVTDLRLTPLARRVKLDALKQREADCTKILTDLIDKVPAAEVKRLLERYESTVTS